MSMTFLTKMFVTFFVLTAEASSSANPSCMKSTMPPMTRRKRWSMFVLRTETSWRRVAVSFGERVWKQGTNEGVRHSCISH